LESFIKTCSCELNPSWPPIAIFQLHSRQCAAKPTVRLKKDVSPWHNLGLQRWRKLCAQYLPS